MISRWLVWDPLIETIDNAAPFTASDPAFAAEMYVQELVHDGVLDSSETPLRLLVASSDGARTARVTVEIDWNPSINATTLETVL